jgi:hypothetical protein
VYHGLCPVGMHRRGLGCLTLLCILGGNGEGKPPAVRGLLGMSCSQTGPTGEAVQPISRRDTSPFLLRLPLTHRNIMSKRITHIQEISCKIRQTHLRPDGSSCHSGFALCLGDVD